MKSIFKTTVFLLSILAGITVSSQLGLQSPGFVGQLNKKSSSSCATTDTTLAHDEFLEGFQTATTGYNDGNAWTVAEFGTTANIDSFADSSSLTSGKPYGACDRALQISVPADGTETYTRWTNNVIDVDASGLLFQFYFYADSAPSSGQTHAIAELKTAGNTQTAQVLLRESGGNMQLSAVSSSDASAWTTLTANAWHLITISLDASGSAEGSYVKIDAGSNATFTRTSGRDVAFMLLGVCDLLGASEGGGPYWYDVAVISTP